MSKEFVNGKDIGKIIDNTMPCNCIDAYKKRNLIAPDCPNCNYKEDLVENIRSLCLKSHEAIVKELNRKGEALCEQNGKLLIENHQLQQSNQRYREAIEEIIKIHNKRHNNERWICDCDACRVAKRALEGSR
jgi:hypothetical protein